jgi:hypothetical protein
MRISHTPIGGRRFSKVMAGRQAGHARDVRLNEPAGSFQA